MEKTNKTSNCNQFIIPNNKVVKFAGSDSQLLVSLIESALTHSFRASFEKNEDYDWVDKDSNKKENGEKGVPDIKGFRLI